MLIALQAHDKKSEDPSMDRVVVNTMENDRERDDLYLGCNGYEKVLMAKKVFLANIRWQRKNMHGARLYA